MTAAAIHAAQWLSSLSVAADTQCITEQLAVMWLVSAFRLFGKLALFRRASLPCVSVETGGAAMFRFVTLKFALTWKFARDVDSRCSSPEVRLLQRCCRTLDAWTYGSSNSDRRPLALVVLLLVIADAYFIFAVEPVCQSLCTFISYY